MIVEAFICAYNEEDILPWVLRHLHGQGVKTHLIDNWSTDRTHEIGRQLADSVERFPAQPSATYDWTDLLSRVETLAASSKADWCMHHDSDEIRRSCKKGESLIDGFARIESEGYTAMNFRVVNFLPIDDGWAEENDPEIYFRHYEARSDYDRQFHVKAWKNFGEKVDLHSRGGHEVWFPQLHITLERFIIKHYGIRNQLHGEKKVFRDRQPRWNPRERRDGWHVQYDGFVPGHVFLSDPRNLEVWNE